MSIRIYRLTSQLVGPLGFYHGRDEQEAFDRFWRNNDATRDYLDKRGVAESGDVILCERIEDDP